MQKQIPSRGVAAALAFLLGGFGFHLLYTRNIAGGVIWFLTSVLLSWTVVVPLLFWFVAIVQGIMYLCWDEKTWALRFEE